MSRCTIFNKQLGLALLLLLSSGNMLRAQDFSYVYIQGDKKTPIYAKVEGVMLPRYGKNYALISRLAPGPMDIEILFQQNEYPPVRFSVLVPEQGKRAFVLSKRDDGFALFDVEQNFYLKANNDISADHLPRIISNEANTAATAPIENNNASPELRQGDTETKAIENSDVAVAPVASEQADTVAVASDKTPEFISNITFNNEAVEESNSTSGNLAASGVINSDCPTSINYIDFIKLKNRVNTRQVEDEKLGIILDAIKGNCFTTEQAKELVEKLETDIAKFSALKSLYPKVSDQANYSKLETLLSGAEWKSYFNDLAQGQ